MQITADVLLGLSHNRLELGAGRGARKSGIALRD